MTEDFLLGALSGVALAFLSLLTAASVLRARRDAEDTEALEKAVVRHLRRKP